MGPEVTTTWRPASGPAAPSARSTAATISATSAMRPGPYSPQAIAPSTGPIRSTPSASSVAALRRVAGCSHMRTFIAGAISTRVSVAISRVEARSSAAPWAIFDIRSAVAGATTTRSAARDSSICPISASSVRSKRSRYTLRAASAAALSGVTNCSAAGVSTGVTCAPRSRRRRISSRLRNAAMPPPMIRRMDLPPSITPPPLRAKSRGDA